MFEESDEDEDNEMEYLTLGHYYVVALLKRIYTMVWITLVVNDIRRPIRKTLQRKRK